MSTASVFLHFVFDPIKAALGRASTSSSPAAQSTAAIVTAALTSTAANIQAAAATTLSAPLTANSAAGLANTAIKDVEDGLLAALDGYLTATVGSVPIVGPMLAAEAVVMANQAANSAFANLALAEQHALNYVSALFGHAKAQIPQPSATGV